MGLQTPTNLRVGHGQGRRFFKEGQGLEATTPTSPTAAWEAPPPPTSLDVYLKHLAQEQGMTFTRPEGLWGQPGGQSCVGSPRTSLGSRASSGARCHSITAGCCWSLDTCPSSHCVVTWPLGTQMNRCLCNRRRERDEGARQAGALFEGTIATNPHLLALPSYARLLRNL